MDTVYKGYDKIPHSSTDWKINTKKINKKVKWIITEKIHGSCFCFVYNNLTKEIKCAKRKQILLDDELFFGYKQILSETVPKINKICEYVTNNLKIESTHIYIYGELFGGIYPNIPSSNKPVQCGVYYSPNLHFYAFDILYVSSINNEQIYIDYKDAISAFRHSKILFAEPLKTFDSYEEAITYPIRFNSTIPKKLNLPELRENLAEGIVIRSSIGHYLVKMKIVEFIETNETYTDNGFDKNINDLDKYKNLCSPHITQNRFNNAISKIGELELKKR